MTATSGSQRGSIFSLGIDYTDTPHNVLTTVGDAEAVARFFAEEGFAREPSERSALERADPATILAAVDRWADALRARRPRSGVAVVYLGGHGRNYNGTHYTLAATSPAAVPYTPAKAIKAHDLVDIVVAAEAEYAVVVFDSCHSGGAAADLLDASAAILRNNGPGGTRLIGLVSAWTHEKAESGALAGAMLRVLGSFSSGTEYLTAFELERELSGELTRQTVKAIGETGAPVFPNANYQPDGPDRTAEVASLLSDLDRDDREHFLLKASGADALDIGWFFEGRVEPTRQILDWLRTSSGGMLVVTGRPGAGKSALLGRLAVLADGASQRACRRLGMLDGDRDLRPDVGAFDAVVHLKNRSYGRAATELAALLGIDIADASDPANALLNSLIDSGRAVCVVADALDEADTSGNADLIARGLLRRLAALPGCRVVVGSRRDREGTITPADDDPGPLLRALGAASVVDLDTDPNVDLDIAAYVERSLERSGRWPTSRRRTTAGQAISAAASGVFLFARFAVRAIGPEPEAIVDDPGWVDRLPADTGRAGLYEVFRTDLARFEHPDVTHELLRPLAYALGKGLPRREVWPAIASTLSAAGRVFNDADVGAVIRDAGWYLIESTEDGQTVYRLYHQAIADYLRQETRRAL